MPLLQGHSPAIVSHNIQEMQKAGHPHDQAVAAAMHLRDQSLGLKPCPHCNGSGHVKK